MSKVAIVTDSTAYLPKDLVQEYGIHVLSLKVIWGEESLDDGIDISPTEFYIRLSQSPTMPTTSQVTIGEFQQLFEKLDGEGYEILAILISGALSGTMASAIQAKGELPDATIELFDSQSTISELGFQVLAAARAAQSGASLTECVAATENARENSGVVFAVDTMEFLHRGGRIGGGKRFLGTLLNIKPILTVSNGKVDALDQARTRKKALNRLIEIVNERVAGKSNVRIGVGHANDLENAKKFLTLASEKIDPVETMITELSPVIGTHVGPGCLALAYHFDDK
jgi:DegV family protein with EDD domain